MKKVFKFNLVNIFTASCLLISTVYLASAVLIKTHTAQAATCGGAVVCNCGDTVTSDYTLNSDLTCAGNGLIIGADNITINGNGHTITRSVLKANNAIDNTNGFDNIVIKNLSISNFIIGVKLVNTNNSTFENITINLTDTGISLNTSDYNNLLNNTILSYNGIFLLSSNNNNITNNHTNNGYRGISLENSTFNNLTNNTSNFNTQDGIFLTKNSDNNTLRNNTVNYNNNRGIAVDDGQNLGLKSINNLIDGNTADSNAWWGIVIYRSSPNTIINNTISRNKYIGITFVVVSDIIFTNNNFINNRRDIQLSSATFANYSENYFENNTTSMMLTHTEIDPNFDVNDTITFNTAMRTGLGVACPTCMYEVSTYPTETINTIRVTNNLTSNFTAKKSGIYSLMFLITEPGNNNVTRKNFKFYVSEPGASVTKVLRYYFSAAVPTHGQPILGDGSDTKSFLLTEPTLSEYGDCTDWVQASIDELPAYPYGNIKQIDTENWYHSESAAGANIKLERYVTYTMLFDLSSADLPVTPVSVPPVYPPNPNEYFWTTDQIGLVTFASLNWVMTPENWYKLTLKLVRGGSPPPGTTPTYWITFPAGDVSGKKSYMDITYEYSTAPGIKTISNENIDLLSAIQPDPLDPKSAEITLSGIGSTDILVDTTNRPFRNAASVIDVAGTSKLTVTGLNGIQTYSTVKMDVTPSAGTVTIDNIAWPVTGPNRSVSWRESGLPTTITTNHLVGDLFPSKTYYVYVDNVLFGTYISNVSGEITFLYDDGFSTKTFMVRDTLLGGGRGGETMESGPFPILINNDASQTDSANVTINLDVTGAKDVFISNQADLATGEWIAYANQISWTLSSGLGTKTVYAIFRDELGQTSRTFSDSIEVVEVLAQPEQPEETPTACPPFPGGLEVGNLLKLRDRTTVWIIGTDCLRHTFPNEPTYFTWYDDFRNISVIDPDLMAQIGLGKNVTVKPGTKLVKIESVATIYAVENSSKLRAINTEDQAALLYGMDWNKKVLDVPAVFFVDYIIGEELNNIYPTGTIAQFNGQTDYFYIENGQRRLIEADIFSRLFKDKFVIKNLSNINDYPQADSFPYMTMAELMALSF